MQVDTKFGEVSKYVTAESVNSEYTDQLDIGSRKQVLYVRIVHKLNLILTQWIRSDQLSNQSKGIVTYL